jgi:hypothetical protein
MRDVRISMFMIRLVPPAKPPGEKPHEFDIQPSAKCQMLTATLYQIAYRNLHFGAILPYEVQLLQLRLRRVLPFAF